MRNGSLFAAQRDASFWNRPGHGGVFHVMREDDPGAARCGVMAILQTENCETVDTVEPELRCQRRGCREHWPE